MPSLKPVVRKDRIKLDNKCKIFIRVYHEPGRKVRYIPTPWSIDPKYMKEDGTISNKYPGYNKLNLALYVLLSEDNSIIESIEKDVKYMNINSLVKKTERTIRSGSFLYLIHEKTYS